MGKLASPRVGRKSPAPCGTSRIRASETTVSLMHSLHIRNNLVGEAQFKKGSCCAEMQVKGVVAKDTGIEIFFHLKRCAVTIVTENINKNFG